MTHVPKVGFSETPPMRYVGSKWILAEWIISQFPDHGGYIEPYCGGAAIFFRKHRSNFEVLNDLDGEIVNFFKVLRTRPDELVNYIDLTPYSRWEYEESLAEKPDLCELERARRLYIKAWMSFGAKMAGSSGWRRQTKTETINVVDSWKRLDGLMAAARRLKDAQIENRPALQVIQQYDSPRALFYVDPPYVLDTRSGRYYRHEMSDDDHRELAEVLHSIEGMAILSGYHEEDGLYDDLYPQWIRLEKTTSTTVNNNAVESLWLSPNTVANQLPLFRAMGGMR